MKVVEILNVAMIAMTQAYVCPFGDTILLSFLLLYNDVIATGLQILGITLGQLCRARVIWRHIANVTSCFLQMTRGTARFEFCIDLKRRLILRQTP